MQFPELPKNWTQEERLEVMTGIHEQSHLILLMPTDPANRDEKLKKAKALFKMIETEKTETLNLPSVRETMISDLTFIFQ